MGTYGYRMGPVERDVVLAVSLVFAVVAGARLKSAALVGGPARLGLDDPCLLGYVAGGSPRAVQAAIVYLRALGLLRAGGQPFEWLPAKTLTPADVRVVISSYGDPGPGSDLLPIAVFQALAEEPSALHLPAHPLVADALQTLQTRAQRLGALPDSAQRRRLQASALPAVAVAGLDLLSILASRLIDDPVRAVTSYLTSATVLAAVILYVQASRVTALPAAQALLVELARRFDVPAVSPVLDVPLSEQALSAAGALAVLGGGFEVWAAALFDQPELGRLATCPDMLATPFTSPPAGS
jgi:uncharacterized protein (TIGR04222 family)